MPKISVIVPIFGVEKYIERCARSLFEQTLDDIEYLFIDDCTPDRSIEILKHVLEEYPQRKSQVVLHRMEQNSGQAAVRKWGMQNATGEYVIHCDPDDWVDVDMYRIMYEKAITDMSDIIICDYYVVYNELCRHMNGCNNIKKEIFINDMLNERISWALWNKLVKRQLYQFDDFIFPKDNMAEDMVMTIQLALRADGISYIPQSLYNYRSTPSSITNSFSENAIWNKYMQVYRNTEILISIFERLRLNRQYDLSFIKWNVRKTLWRIAYKKECFKIWCNTYPELFPILLFSSFLGFREKMKIILTYLGLYPRVSSCRINKMSRK